MRNANYFFSCFRRDGIDINLLFHGFEICGPQHAYGPSLREHFVLHYVVCGEGVYEAEGKNYFVGEGDIFLLWPNQINRYSAKPDNPYQYFWVGFSGAQATNLVQQAGFGREHLVIHSGSNEELLRSFNAISETLTDNSFSSYHLALSEMYRIFAHLSAVNERNHDNSKPESSYIEQSIRYIETNYSTPITIKDIADSLCINRCYLSDLFRKKTQITLQQYLLDYRIAKACGLLVSTGHSIENIAYSVGFNSLSNFCYQFKKHMKVNANEYRRNELRVE